MATEGIVASIVNNDHDAQIKDHGSKLGPIQQCANGVQDGVTLGIFAGIDQIDRV